MATRSAKEEKTYQDYIKNEKKPGCDFCRFEAGDGQVKREETDFYIVENIYGYSHWDSSEVEEHLMIVPKKHVTSLSKLSDTELMAHAKLIQEYEPKGYSTYSRGSESHMKSVPHQHTHLIKLKPGRHKFFLHVQKPYIRFKF